MHKPLQTLQDFHSRHPSHTHPRKCYISLWLPVDFSHMLDYAWTSHGWPEADAVWGAGVPAIKWGLDSRLGRTHLGQRHQGGGINPSFSLKQRSFKTNYLHHFIDFVSIWDHCASAQRDTKHSNNPLDPLDANEFQAYLFYKPLGKPSIPRRPKTKGIGISMRILENIEEFDFAYFWARGYFC